MVLAEPQRLKSHQVAAGKAVVAITNMVHRLLSTVTRMGVTKPTRLPRTVNTLPTMLHGVTAILMSAEVHGPGPGPGPGQDLDLDLGREDVIVVMVVVMVMVMVVVMVMVALTTARTEKESGRRREKETETGIGTGTGTDIEVEILREIVDARRIHVVVLVFVFL